MNIAVVGTGYVGLVSGVCLAEAGHHVTCVDLRSEVVAALNSGQPHFHEPGLPELLRSTIAAGRFRATLNLEEALNQAAMVLVAVGTPSLDGRIDTSIVSDAVAQIGRHLKDRGRFLSVVIKSTVVPSTTDTEVRATLEKHSGLTLGEFGLGMNPEFLREGNAVDDFMNPDRVVLGYEDPKTLELLDEAYRPWNCEKVRVNTRTAEAIKYANNALLATQISAVNELANLCFEVGGVDVREVMEGVHLDKRWSPVTPAGRIRPDILTYLVPGCGFGGSCFRKDVEALRTQGRDRGLPMRMLQAVLDVNDEQPMQIVRQLSGALGDLKGRRILMLGLSFKPNTDDIRDSTSLTIIRRLADQGASVTAHDPIAIQNAREALGAVPVRYVDDWLEPVTANDAVVVATSWPEYRALAEPQHAHRVKDRVLVDGRRMFQPSDFPDSTYLTIGRRGLQ